MSPVKPTTSLTLAKRFRAANDWAVNNHYVGGWPTCYDGDALHGIATLNHEYEDYVGVRDVPIEELGNPPLDNTNSAYRLRLTSAHDYARQKDYAYGRPNFHQDDWSEWGGGIVCGTFLYRDGLADYQDTTTRDLGMTGDPGDFRSNPLEEWFWRLHLYATSNGYATGIPNGHYANYHGWVLGSYLFHSDKVTVHSVPVSELNFY